MCAPPRHAQPFRVPALAVLSLRSFSFNLPGVFAKGASASAFGALYAIDRAAGATSGSALMTSKTTNLVVGASAAATNVTFHADLSDAQCLSLSSNGSYAFTVTLSGGAAQPR